jgi:transcriptional regulator with XRE-family HTH domain
MAVNFRPEALKQARIASGLSRSALAEQSGVALRSIYNFETGIVLTPNPARVRMLADVLGVDVMDLYETTEVAS